MLLTIILIAAISACLLAKQAEARFAYRQTRQVPIARLLKNLQAQKADAMSDEDKAQLDFRIGRLHAMAYALKVETAPCDAQAIPGTKAELPDFGHTPDHVQFRVQNKKPGQSGQSEKLARDHLLLAIANLSAALKKDPQLLAARLGLAWCYEQAQNKSKAIELYREVFDSAFKSEEHAKGGMYNWSISLETAQYLQKLLDPQKDKDELAKLKSRVEIIERLPRYITPLMIPLSDEGRLEECLIDKTVLFDLDGFGKRQYQKWISPEAAWLVFDADQSGEIDSGIKMVGQSSFWIFWHNGYEVLKALDDNNDGKLEGKELDGMALWQDKNSNGVSDAGEVSDLKSNGITGLAHSCTRNHQGILWNQKGVFFKNGTSRPSFDLVLPSIEIQDRSRLARN